MGNLDMAIKKCKKSYQTHQNIPHTTNAKMFNKNDGTVSFLSNDGKHHDWKFITN